MRPMRRWPSRPPTAVHQAAVFGTMVGGLLLLLAVPSCRGFNSVAHTRQHNGRHHYFHRLSLDGHSSTSIFGRDQERSSVRASATGDASGPEAEATVALTREAGKNGKLAKLLADAGISSVEIPCIAHQDGPDLPLLPTALADPSLAYVVVTSPEAAKVFLAGWTKAGKPSVPVACVGKATGDALRAEGVSPAFTPSKATGETLAAEIPLVPPPPPTAGGVGSTTASATATETGAVGGTDGADADDGGGAGPSAENKRSRVLYPASAKAQKTVEKGLQARGFDVRRLNTYDTVPASWDESAEAAAAGAAVAAFGSPSAVKTWAARMGVAREPGEVGGALAACIGETSARACREAGWPESTIFYPEKPGMEGWAKAVGDALTAVENTSAASAATAA